MYFLEGHIDRGEELPQVVVLQGSRNAESKMLAAVAVYVLTVMDGEGKLPRDLSSTDGNDGREVELMQGKVCTRDGRLRRYCRGSA